MLKVYAKLKKRYLTKIIIRHKAALVVFVFNS